MPQLTPFCIETTPPGRGGIGVVEVVGRGGWQAVRKLVAGRRFGRPPRMALVNLADSRGAIDEAIVAFVPAGQSQTGIETLEINLHGGPMCVSRLISALANLGVPMRTARHFFQAAMRQGKLDRVQVEALRLLPEAITLRAAAMLAAQHKGALSRRLLAITAQMSTVRARGRRCSVKRAVSSLQKLLDSAKAGIALAHPQLCVIAGVPNVGKSALFNALLGKDRAIVHEAAGTTRDFVDACSSCDGLPFRLVDTAGMWLECGMRNAECGFSREEAQRAVCNFGGSKRSRSRALTFSGWNWSFCPAKEGQSGGFDAPNVNHAESSEIDMKAQKQSRLLIRKARIMLWVWDAGELTAQVKQSACACAAKSTGCHHSAQQFVAPGVRKGMSDQTRTILVLNKTDKVSIEELSSATASALEFATQVGLQPSETVCVSALTGAGIDELRNAVLRGLLGDCKLSPPASPQVFTVRQYRGLTRASRALKLALSLRVSHPSQARAALKATVETIRGVLFAT